MVEFVLYFKKKIKNKNKKKIFKLNRKRKKTDSFFILFSIDIEFGFVFVVQNHFDLIVHIHLTNGKEIFNLNHTEIIVVICQIIVCIISAKFKFIVLRNVFIFL